MRINWGIILFVSAMQSFAYGASNPPCLGEDGQIKNIDPTKACKKILPSCKTLKQELVDNAKDLLEWKFYGYYWKGLDLDLTKSGKGNLVGDPLPYPMCSVVGHELKRSAVPNDLEVERQAFGMKQSCGSPPVFKHKKTNYKTEIKYKGDGGTNWASYVLGAKMYAYRAAAFDVLSALKDDLSNFEELVSQTNSSDTFKDAYSKLGDFYTNLSAESKALCESTSTEENLVTQCTSGQIPNNSPIVKICNLVTAQLSFNKVSATNALIGEISARAEDIHYKHFATIFDSSNPDFKKLVKHCGNSIVPDSVRVVATQVLGPAALLAELAILRMNYSCSDSCLDMGYRYYTGAKDGDNEWPAWRTDENDNAQAQRKCKAEVRYSLKKNRYENKTKKMFLNSFTWTTESVIDGITKIFNHASGDKNVSEFLDNISEFTFSSGFGAMVEKIIRLDICKQTDKSAPNKCDLVNIKLKNKEL